VHDTVTVEGAGKPAVMICNEDFLNLAKEVSSRTIPGLRFVAETVPAENTVFEKARAGISPVIDDIIAALTRPLTAEETSPKGDVIRELPRIIFKGDLEEVNRFFYQRGWTDGLPIIPPTEEKVKEMLTGTDLPPDHLMGQLDPGLGKLTVEKIAINAVMAGALPTYMPVLIAGVEALLDPARKFYLHLVSTGSWAPFLIINGPVRKDLKVNKGFGALSPGIMANAALGRALGLIIQNAAQARKGIEDKGQIGNPERYGMVMAEDEDANPWSPLHVERGFQKEDSVVTLHYPHQFVQAWALGTDPKGILTAITYNAMPSAPGQTCLLLSADHAKILAEAGWTKEDIKGYVSRFARCPANRHIFSIARFQPKSAVPLDDTDLRPLFVSPDDILVIVGGGNGAFFGLFSGGYLGGGTFVSKKVQLPNHWAALVKKYKNVVPNYCLGEKKVDFFD
jgi:hypothetical protein